MRPVWKGSISFGLVSIPVSLLTAEKRNELKFNLLDSKDTSRIRYERVSQESGEIVPWDRIVKGYEISEGNYVLLEDEDFRKVQVEGTKTIEISSFINYEELNPMSLETPYYILPAKGGEKPYVLLREVLQETQKFGIARVVLRTKEYLCAVYPSGNALVLNLMRFASEIRTEKDFDFPTSAKISDKETKLAKQLVESMTEKWDSEAYQDEYSTALMKWIKAKAEKGQVTAVEDVEDQEPVASKAEDIMELLLASIGETSTKKPAAKEKQPAAK